MIDIGIWRTLLRTGPVKALRWDISNMNDSVKSWTAAADAMGTLGAICWSIQLLPQIYQNYRRKHTHGLQPTMMLLWASAGIPLGAYNITRSFPVALQIQPQILTLLSLITWAQTKYYPPGGDKKVRSVLWCTLTLTAVCALAGGMETAIVYGLKAGIKTKSEFEVEHYWAVMLMGILSAVLLAAGVGRHYIDIYKERTVRGISFIFVAIDALGDLTSLISVLFWWRAGRRLDVLGLIVYGSELVLWIGVMTCGIWYNFRPWFSAKMKNESGTGGATTETPSTHVDEVSRVRSSAASSRSTTSHNSGTVFRTASGHVGIEDRPGLTSIASHDTFRLRHIVQV